MKRKLGRRAWGEVLAGLLVICSSYLLIAPSAAIGQAADDGDCTARVGLDGAQHARVGFVIRCSAQTQSRVVVRIASVGPPSIRGATPDRYSRAFVASGVGASGGGYCRQERQLTCVGRYSGPATFRGWLSIDAIERCRARFLVSRILPSNESGDDWYPRTIVLPSPVQYVPLFKGLPTGCE